jgi:hypothetical protein
LKLRLWEAVGSEVRVRIQTKEWRVSNTTLMERFGDRRMEVEVRGKGKRDFGVDGGEGRRRR